MTYLTNQEITETFINTKLEEDYNFLQDDLVKLANAFIAAAEQKIRNSELNECFKVAKAYNAKVAEKMLEVMSKT